MNKLVMKIENGIVPQNTEIADSITIEDSQSIILSMTVHGKHIGEIELYLHNDSADGSIVGMEDEYTLSFRRFVPEEYMDEDNDPFMVTQGNIAPRV